MGVRHHGKFGFGGSAAILPKPKMAKEVPISRIYSGVDY
jgi:hypothetical protein